ncbi:MAG: type II toxin-antitoxin system VapC family toxin [Spirochaetota bacterium]
MKLFIDSSALVKRYIHEEGTDVVNQLCANASEVAVSILCVTEVLSACDRLLREEKINNEQYQWIKNELFLDIEQSIVIDITHDVVKTSILCLEKGSIRTLNALQAASAHIYECDLFITSDKRQGLCAEETGLPVKKT